MPLPNANNYPEEKKKKKEHQQEKNNWVFHLHTTKKKEDIQEL